MAIAPYDMVAHELRFLGDIFGPGIIKKGLAKIGATPERATPDDLIKAIDAHIEASIVSFVGRQEAHKLCVRLKLELAKLESKGGAA